MVAMAFNAQQFSPQYAVAGGGLPEGMHPVTITNSEMKPTSKGDGGQFLELTLTAYDGLAKGLQQTDRLNITNKNTQTVDIACKQLAAYCYVCGVPNMTDTQQLHAKPFIVVIGKQPNQTVDAQGNTRVYTEVKDLRKIDGSEIPKAGAQPGAAFGGQVAPAPPAPPAPGGWTQPGGAAPAGGQWQAPQGSPPAPTAPPGGQWQGPPPGTAPAAPAGNGGWPGGAPTAPAATAPSPNAGWQPGGAAPAAGPWNATPGR